VVLAGHGRARTLDGGSLCDGLVLVFLFWACKHPSFLNIDALDGPPYLFYRIFRWAGRSKGSHVPRRGQVITERMGDNPTVCLDSGPSAAQMASSRRGKTWRLAGERKPSSSSASRMNTKRGGRVQDSSVGIPILRTSDSRHHPPIRARRPSPN
jgi:hypothetical protein